VSNTPTPPSSSGSGGGGGPTPSSGGGSGSSGRGTPTPPSGSGSGGGGTPTPPSSGGQPSSKQAAGGGGSPTPPSSGGQPSSKQAAGGGQQGSGKDTGAPGGGRPGGDQASRDANNPSQSGAKGGGSSGDKGGSDKGSAGGGDKGGPQKDDKGGAGDKKKSDKPKKDKGGKDQKEESRGEKAAGAAGEAAGTYLGGKVGGEIGKRVGKFIYRVSPIFVLFALGVVGVATVSSDNEGADVGRAVRESEYLQSKAVKEIRSAVKGFSSEAKYGGTIPWGLVAGIALTSTEFGKISPYPEDLCDRAPKQEALRAKPGLALAACPDSKSSSYPRVSPAIGDAELNQGVGPYLLLPGAIPSSVDAQAIKARGRWGRFIGSKTSATEYIIGEIDRIRKRMVNKEGFVITKYSKNEELQTFWSEVLYRLPLADPNAADCVAPVLPENPQTASVATAIATTWRCHLNSKPYSLYDPRLADDQQLVARGATDMVLTEALTAAWAFSAYGQGATGTPGAEKVPTGCVKNVTATTSTNAEGVEVTVYTTSIVANVADDQPAGVFPLTKSVFDEHKDPSSTANRCDVAQNIVAAVKAFLSVEYKDREDRDDDSGEKAAGGWAKMRWTLGDDATFETIRSGAVWRNFDPTGADKACGDAVTAWVDALAAGKLLDPASGLELSDGDGDRVPDALVGSWANIMIDVAISDPRGAGKACASRIDGSVERFASAVAFSKQVVKEIGHDHAADVDVVPEVLVPVIVVPEEGADASTTTTTTTLPPPPVMSAEDISYAGVRSVMNYLAALSVQNSAIPAVPGVDSVIERLSINGNVVEGVPLVQIPSDSRINNILSVASILSGLGPRDEKYDKRITGAGLTEKLQGILPSIPGGGAGLDGIPVVLIDAVNKAVVTSKTKYPQCTMDTALMLGFARTEAGGGLRTITSNGDMVPRFIHTGNSSNSENDQGVLDGDPLADHAVGAFGSDPGTWVGYKSQNPNINPRDYTTWTGYGRDADGNGDGVRDPNNVYDAALGAIFQVCANAGAKDLIAWGEDFITALATYVGGGGALSTTETRECYSQGVVTKRVCTEWLAKKKWDAAAQLRALLLAPRSSGGSGRGSIAVPPELLNYGNGDLPSTMLQSVGIGGHRLYSPAAIDFMAMVQAAKAANIVVTITDSYRDSAGQLGCPKKPLSSGRPKSTSDGHKWMVDNGLLVLSGTTYIPSGELTGMAAFAIDGLAYCAKPGSSNHGWGLAIDVNLEWTGTERWMHNNAPTFGWCDIGGGTHEPWHYQYIGRGAVCNSSFGGPYP
jgi:hypothetical protein